MLSVPHLPLQRCSPPFCTLLWAQDYISGSPACSADYVQLFELWAELALLFCLFVFPPWNMILLKRTSGWWTMSIWQYIVQKKNIQVFEKANKILLLFQLHICTKPDCSQPLQTKQQIVANWMQKQMWKSSCFPLSQISKNVKQSHFSQYFFLFGEI